MLPSTVDTVNAWANANTNGKIPRILDSIDQQIVMLLMNAIYFKGDWRAEFKTAETADLPFKALRGADVSVPTMHRKGGFRRGHVNNASVAELPYGGDAFVMTILLPDEGVNINTFVAGLTAAIQPPGRGVDALHHPCFRDALDQDADLHRVNSSVLRRSEAILAH